jgi:hypothetical protein
MTLAQRTTQAGATTAVMRIIAVALLGFAFSGCASIKKENAAIGRTVKKENTAIDRTFRTDVQQVECPISFTLSPGLLNFTIIPRIVYRNPAAAPTALATEKGTVSR